ncbi:MAG: NAD(P)H-binding protein [Paludibacteraceae bacterium]
MKTAIVIGSTGMVGVELIRQLIENKDYSNVISLVRRASGVKHSKLSEHIVDFDKPESWAEFVKGDVLFSTMGTTIRNAKTKENQFKVDYTYQYEVAKIAAENGVPTYVLVSSIGAKSSSANFYLKTKGRLEEDVKKLSFRAVIILCPGQLDGDRQEQRPMEKTALEIMYIVNKIGLFKKYRPILAEEVAKAMINVAGINKSETYELNNIFNLI